MQTSTFGPSGQVVPLGGSEGLPGMYPLNGVLGIRFRDPAEDRWFVEFGSRMVHRQTFVATSLSEIPTPGFTVFNLRGYYRVNKNLRSHGRLREPAQPGLQRTGLAGDHRPQRRADVRAGTRLLGRLRRQRAVLRSR